MDLQREELLERLRECFPKRQKKDLIKFFAELAAIASFENEDSPESLLKPAFTEALFKFKNVQQLFTKDEISSIFDSISMDDSVTASLFAKHVRGGLSEYRKALVQYIFRKLDRDNSGFIEFEELSKFYNDSCIPMVVGQTPTALSLNFFSRMQFDFEDEASDTDGISFLVVDDSQMIVKTTKKMISKSGHKSESASNGKQALALMLQKPFDVVLMDIQVCLALSHSTASPSPSPSPPNNPIRCQSWTE